VATLLWATAALAADAGLDGGTGPLLLSTLVPRGEVRANVFGASDAGFSGLGRGTAQTGSARAGTPTVSGPLDGVLVRRVIRAHLGLVKKCSAEHLPRSRDPLTGEVTVAFTISAGGGVTDTAVTRSAWTNAGLDECLVGVVRRLRFPAPDGGVVLVSHPFSVSATPGPD
jgi:TonB family protein